MDRPTIRTRSPKHDDEVPRGAIFLFISAKAMATIEFLQQEWINDGNFIGAGNERDPIIGRQEEGATFTIPKAASQATHPRHRNLQRAQGRRVLLRAEHECIEVARKPGMTRHAHEGEHSHGNANATATPSRIRTRTEQGQGEDPAAARAVRRRAGVGKNGAGQRDSRADGASVRKPPPLPLESAGRTGIRRRQGLRVDHHRPVRAWRQPSGCARSCGCSAAT